MIASKIGNKPINKWVEKKSGSIIYNSPYNPHGMKVGKVPFVSIWCWPHNLIESFEIGEREENFNKKIIVEHFE